MTARLADLSAHVPRYTSYPTAPHFHRGIDEKAYVRWLSETPSGASLSLYVHVPFCDTLCWFCACHTRVVNKYGPIAKYLGFLEREIDRVADILGAGRRVEHIHWGGGSPTILSPDHLVRLSDRLRLRFPRAEEAEFAVEIDPRGLSAETVAALAAAGVTRASLGVQDFDERVQQAINRRQSFETTRDAVASLREAGIGAINIDLVYGLPFQTKEGIARTIDSILSLSPNRLSVFGYAHVPHMKKHQNLIETGSLPNAAARRSQFDAIQGLLASAGYVAIGLDHFARPDDPMAAALSAGKLGRNFQGYTTDRAAVLVGFGASAIGALAQGYVQNTPDVRSYESALAEGRLPVARGVALTDDDCLRRAVITRLMCELRADLGELTDEFGKPRDTFSTECRALDEFARDGLVTIKDDVVEISPDARAYVRLVASVFDRYLTPSPAGHSPAL
jgi:oxygen-independent coproporphyrinogen-3 oxidase